MPTSASPRRWFSAARELSRGDVARVLLAAHNGPTGYDQLAVVRSLLPNVRSDHNFVQSFLVQAHLAAALSHPNIVEISEVIHDDDTVAVVMEYLSGEDLRYLLKTSARAGKRIPLPLVCAIIHESAAGLDAGHTADGPSRGVLHRDLTPSNVVVTYNGAVKLIDFGIARADGDSALFSAARAKERLPYFSPERARADDHDPRSDLFSLGAIFHEMLTSRRLFSGPSPAAIRRNIMERRIPPPSVYNPKVSEQLDRVVLRLLERDPRKRTPSAAALLEELSQLPTLDPNTGRRQLARWLRGAVPGRLAARRRMEQRIAQEGEAAHTPISLDAAFSQLFADGEEIEPAGLLTTTEASAAAIANFDDAGPRPATESSDAAPPNAHRTGARASLLLAMGGIGGLIIAALVGVLLMTVTGDDPEVTAQPANLEVAAPPVQQLEPSPAVTTVGLLLHAVPNGSQVAIDGTGLDQTVGTDGLLVPVPRGATIRLSVSKEGYRTYDTTLETPDAGTTPIYVTLVRNDDAGTNELHARSTNEGAERDQPANDSERHTGRRERASAIQIAVEPNTAQISIDGAASASGSPLVATLAPGDHTIRVSAPGHLPLERTITVESGTKYDMHLELTEAAPLRARVDIHSQPAGTVVRVSGQLKGTTPILGLMLKADEPVTVDLRHEGYQSWRQEVIPTIGKRTVVNATLRPTPTRRRLQRPERNSATRTPSQPSTEPRPAAPQPTTAAAATAPQPSGPVIVPAVSVTKLRGTVPELKLRAHTRSGLTNVSVKLCIDAGGRVTDVTLLTKLPASASSTLVQALRTWRYRPYQQAGSSVPACFPVNFSVDSSEL